MRAFRVLVFVLLFGLAFWFAAPRPLHAQSPTTLEEYRRAVAQALNLAQQANKLAVSERTALLEQAQAQLEPIHAVEISPGVQTNIDNASLLALLNDANKTDAAIQRLTALRDVLAQTPPVLYAADLDTLRDILNRPPFIENSSETWLQELLRRVLEFWSRLFDNTARGVFDARDLFLLLGVVVVIVVVIYFVLNLRRNVVGEETLPPLTSEEQVRSPAEAFDNAQRFINAGDYRRAVRQLYLATLLMLDQRGKLKYDPTLTNREVLRQASNDPQTTSALQPIVETFDRVWYGFQPLSQSEFDAYRARVEKVRE